MLALMEKDKTRREQDKNAGQCGTPACFAASRTVAPWSGWRPAWLRVALVVIAVAQRRVSHVGSRCF
jgi:hypothetical protein